MDLIERRLLPIAIAALTAYAYVRPDPRAWYGSATLTAALALVAIARTLPKRRVVFAPPVVPKEVWRFIVRGICIPLMVIFFALVFMAALNRVDGASLNAIRMLALLFPLYAIYVATADPRR